jgi:hypothetical protein
MKKYRIRACGISYEVTYEQDVEANSIADAVALTRLPDREWIFCDAMILEVNLPDPQDYYGDDGNWQIFEVAPDGTEKEVTEADEEVSA